MVKHIVMWKLKEENKAENAAKMCAILRDLQGKVPVIVDLSVGVDFNRSDAAWDIALCVTLASPTDVDSYQTHPDHVKAGEFVKSVAASRAVVDFEY